MAKFKGKYPGPDVLKGDKTKLKSYRTAIKSGTSKKDALAQAIKATAAASTTAKPKTPAVNQNVYPTSNVATNSSGTVQLQTNAEIEEGLLQAEQQALEAENEATLQEQQAGITKAQNEEQFRLAARDQRGRLNAATAYRGLRGRSALRKKEVAESELTSQKNAINQQHSLALQAASSRRLAGQEYRRKAKAWATQARLDYTNQRSRTAPTVGSTPVAPGSTGVKATKAYKGKYPGPDRFKGDEKKIAAWKAAQRKAAK